MGVGHVQDSAAVVVVVAAAAALEKMWMTKIPRMGIPYSRNVRLIFLFMKML